MFLMTEEGVTARTIHHTGATAQDGGHRILVQVVAMDQEGGLVQDFQFFKISDRRQTGSLPIPRQDSFSRQKLLKLSSACEEEFQFSFGFSNVHGYQQTP